MYKTLFLFLIENNFNKTWLYLCSFYQAGVVKLVDTLDLGSSASQRGGSSPFTRTKPSILNRGFFFETITS